jgi:flagellar biosynthesis GTPase FlhF
MKLKTVVQTLDGLSEEIAQLYTKSGESYVLSLDGIDEHPEVKGLSSAIKAVRTEKKTIEEQLTELSNKIAGIDLEKVKDIDPEKYQEHLAELQRLKDEEDQRQKQKLKDEQKWEKLEQQLMQSHEDKIKGLEEKYTREIEDLKTGTTTEKEQLMGALKENLKDRELTAALAKAGGNIPILTPHIAPYVDVKKMEDGSFKAVVIDKEGKPRMDDKGQLLTIESLVGEFKEKPEFQGDGLFKVEQKPGGASSGGNRDTSANDDGNNPFAKETFNLTQQAILKNTDPQKYERLKQAAAGEDK